ncbi:MAG: NupC/NupG family nucleoside CNT transporter [Candidatus Cyclobacteriaceae bacterium M3_2C_046]
MDYFKGLLGILVLLLIAFLFSENKKIINWRLVASGILLQIIMGFLLLKVPLVTVVFRYISAGFVRLLSFANDGAQFLFGDLANDSYMFIFAFQVLPVIIFFSALSSALYYLGVLQKIVVGIAWVMSKTMRLSGSESLSAAGNIFIGQTEAPLLVRPYIPGMTKSEIMCLMTGGMATIAGSVLAAYVSFLGGDDPEQQTRFAAFLLTASFMNAPAAIVASKIMIPEANYDQINRDLRLNREEIGVNLIDALTRGAGDGLKLALNVGAMLLSFIALIAGINYLLADVLGELTGLNQWISLTTDGTFDRFSLEYLLGQVFRVFAFIMGVEWSQSLSVGSLLGQKTVINEFVAYLSLADMKSAGILSEKSIVIATFVLCGFANFGSIAIQIGGIGGMAPNQQGILSKIGFRSLFAATIATMLSATIAGVLVS